MLKKEYKECRVLEEQVASLRVHSFFYPQLDTYATKYAGHDSKSRMCNN